MALLVAAGANAQYLRGVNVSGAEFGENSIPGVIGQSHTYNSLPTFQYFASRSLSLIRLPFRWERLQPVLRGPLDPTNLSALKQDVAWAKASGCQIVLDPHNYGRYKINENGSLNEYVIDNVYSGVVKVSAGDFADFWSRLSAEFKNEPAVYAYDLMNEPHDMGTSSWKSISQTALSAIRANGDTKRIMVPGDNWSGAYSWVLVHGSNGWINDPAGNYMYEAHQYFDSDNSGSYAHTYDQELAANPNLPMVGVTRVTPFLNWCKNNNVSCYLGEYGSPNTDARWNTVLHNFLAALDTAGIPGTFWAAGEWWGTYALSVQPLNSFTIDRAQTPVLQAHLAPGAFTSVSAAATWGYSVAPDTLAAGYGTNLTSGSDTKVKLTDSSGVSSFAQILFASVGQVNYVVPAGVAAGRVDVQVTSGGTTVGSGVLEVDVLAPTLFSANRNGAGIAAAQVLRIATDGTQTYENVAQLDGSGQYVAVPIDFRGDRLFLLLYGTGFDAASAMNTTLQVATSALTVAYAGPQGQYVGLDQINAELPSSLAGSGVVTLVVTVGGRTANPLSITFK